MAQKKPQLVTPALEVRMAQAKTLAELDGIYKDTIWRATDRYEVLELNAAYEAAKRRLPLPADTVPDPNDVEVHRDRLLRELDGPYCQGCGGKFDPAAKDEHGHRLLQIDHVVPKSDQGSDEYYNLTLLCGGGVAALGGGCNQRKGNDRTLGWLQDQNRKNGKLTADREKHIRHGRLKH